MNRPRRSQNNRDKLLNYGVSAFIKQGYHATGIKEVVQQVSVPKGSFYNYFESKEGFGAEAIRQYTQQYLVNMDALLSQPKVDALSALKHFFEAEIQRHKEGREGCLLGNLGAELGESRELCRQALSEGLQAMQQRFTQVIDRAQAEGTVRNDIAAKELASFLLNAYEGALVRMQIEQSVAPLQQLSLLMLDRFLQA